MSGWQRSLVVLVSGSSAVVLATLMLAFVIVGDTTAPRREQRNSASDPDASQAVQPGPTSGIGGMLTITGDRTGTLILDREVVRDRYALAGQDGQVFFEGQPATVSRIDLEGLSFYLDPGDCEHAAGERDDATGLAALEVSCVEISDVRGSAVLTVEGTLGLPADQLGLRGDLPPTGGTVTVGNETLTFEEASLDLRRPEVIETRPGFTTRYPVVYPLSVSGQGGALQFEYDSNARELRLVGIELADTPGQAGKECLLSFRELGELSPRVTVVEMTLDCAAVELDGRGPVPLEGTLVVDIAQLPSQGLQ